VTSSLDASEDDTMMLLVEVARREREESGEKA